MEIYKLLYDALFIAAETLILIIFIRNSIEENTNSITAYLVMVLFQIMRRVLFGEIGLISLLPSIAVDILIISFFYRGNLKKIIFLVIVFYAFGFIFDSAAILIITFFYSMFTQTAINADDLLFLAVILSKSMVCLIILSLKDSFKTKNNLSEWMKYMPALVFTIIALVIGSPYTNDVNNNEVVTLLIIICVLSLISTVFLISNIQKLNEKAQLEYRLKMLDETKRFSIEHHQELLEAYRQIERTAHNIKHHFDYIEASLDHKSAIEYAQKIKKRSFSQVFRFTGNFDVDAILNAKNNEATEKGIFLTINNVLPLNINWIDSVDICILLGNSLNNAIEACERCNGKNITVSFKYTEDWLLITVENPTHEVPVHKKIGIGLMSSKKNANHGIGMECMAASVKRYDGDMKYELKNNIFRLDLLLQRNI